LGYGHVAKQIASARQGAQERFALHGLGEDAETLPRRFVEITHHRVGHGAAPDLHDIEAGIFVIREELVDFGLAQACCEERLLTIAKGKVADFEFLIFHIV